MNSQDAKRVLETALICASQPLPLRDMRVLFADELGPDTLRSLLDELTREWEGRGVELVALASGWRLQSRPEMREFLDRLNPEKPPKYSRAVLETLAIIAYRQPITTPEIQAIRGTDPTSVLEALLEKQLVRVLGRKKVVGKPILYGTTPQFLTHFGLNTLEDLPDMADFGVLAASGPAGGAPAGAAETSSEALAARGPFEEEGGDDAGNGEDTQDDDDDESERQDDGDDS